jgi:hypothetical protein
MPELSRAAVGSSHKIVFVSGIINYKIKKQSKWKMQRQKSRQIKKQSQRKMQRQEKRQIKKMSQRKEDAETEK